MDSIEHQNNRINIVLEGNLTAVTGLATTSDGLTKKPREQVEYQPLPRMAGTPIIRATGMAGGFRRALSDEILRALGEGRYPYDSVHAWFLNRQGGVASFGVPLKVDDKTNEAMDVRRKNPVLSVFGIGGLPGKIAIEPAIPIIPENSTIEDLIARDSGFRGDDIRRDPGMAAELPTTLLDEYVLLRFGAQSENNTIAAFGALAARRAGDSLHGNPVVAQAYAAINGDYTDPDASKSDETFTSIMNPYGGYEYFVPGTQFRHRMSLMGLTRDEAAMVIGALYAFSRHPVIGGHRRSGMGHVSMSYRVMTFDEDPRAVPQADGDLNITSRTDLRGEDGSRPAFESTSPLVNDLLEHFLTLAKAGFPGMDFNAGVRAEFQGLKNQAKKAEEHKVATKKSAQKKEKKEKDAQGADTSKDED